MNITFLGMDSNAILAMQILERTIPAHYIALSSKPAVLKQFCGEQIVYSCRPSMDAAALRILSKVNKHTKDADIVFLLSEITGKINENMVLHIAKKLENKTVISVVWYPKQKHGLQGIFNTVNQLSAFSSVVAIPYNQSTELPALVAQYTELILRLCNALSKRSVGYR